MYPIDARLTFLVIIMNAVRDYIIFALVVIFIIWIIYLKLNIRSIIGRMGERSVSKSLSKLPSDKYIVLNDLLFKDGKYSTQIDHLVVSIYGIFVIETKNCKGVVSGHADRDYWTQKTHGHKYSLYNPLYQNRGHIIFLLKKFGFLRVLQSYIYPIVVFPGVSRLKLNGEYEGVFKHKKLRSYIRSFREEVITIEDCRRIASVFQCNNIEQKSERKAHKSNVKKAIDLHEKCVRRGICPQCGGVLVLRKGKHHDFYGCSNFPRCRYTR